MNKHCLIALLLLILTNCFAFDYVNQTIPLVVPDASGTKLVVNPEGLEFLTSLNKQTKLAVVAVSGRYKTGKSFLLNNLLGVPHTQGFEVGSEADPQTRGIMVWGNPIQIKIPKHHEHEEQEYMNVIFLDTEGLGAIQNTMHTYDPKLCALSVVLSSLFIYNQAQQIASFDVQLLQSVATLSQIFEQKLNGKKFPFPTILWTIQQFEHGLGGRSEEFFLDQMLQERPNPDDKVEIRNFNATLRAVKQFPTWGAPRLMLFNHPKKDELQKNLSKYPFYQLDQGYMAQIETLRELIMNRIKPKEVDYLPITGEALANLVKAVVDNINELDVPDVGPALVRELSVLLYKKLYKIYVEKMSKLPLPQDDRVLIDYHEQELERVLNVFQSNCTGGVKAYENAKSFALLQQDVQEWHESHKEKNANKAREYCYNILQRLFQPLIQQMQSDAVSIDVVSNRTIELFNMYQIEARGPANVKDQVKDEFEFNMIAPRKEALLRSSASQDFLHIVLYVGAVVLVSLSAKSFLYPFSAFASWFCHYVFVLSVWAGAAAFTTHYKLFGDQFFIKFYHVQSAFRYMFDLVPASKMAVSLLCKIVQTPFVVLAILIAALLCFAARYYKKRVADHNTITVGEEFYEEQVSMRQPDFEQALDQSITEEDIDAYFKVKTFFTPKNTPIPRTPSTRVANTPIKTPKMNLSAMRTPHNTSFLNERTPNVPPSSIRSPSSNRIRTPNSPLFTPSLRIPNHHRSFGVLGSAAREVSEEEPCTPTDHKTTPFAAPPKSTKRDKENYFNDELCRTPTRTPKQLDVPPSRQSSRRRKALSHSYLSELNHQLT